MRSPRPSPNVADSSPVHAPMKELERVPAIRRAARLAGGGNGGGGEQQQSQDGFHEILPGETVIERQRSPYCAGRARDCKESTGYSTSSADTRGLAAKSRGVMPEKALNSWMKWAWS